MLFRSPDDHPPERGVAMGDELDPRTAIILSTSRLEPLSLISRSLHPAHFCWVEAVGFESSREDEVSLVNPTRFLGDSLSISSPSPLLSFLHIPRGGTRDDLDGHLDLAYAPIKE